MLNWIKKFLFKNNTPIEPTLDKVIKKLSKIDLFYDPFKDLNINEYVKFGKFLDEMEIELRPINIEWLIKMSKIEIKRYYSYSYCLKVYVSKEDYDKHYVDSLEGQIETMLNGLRKEIKKVSPIVLARVETLYLITLEKCLYRIKNGEVNKEYLKTFLDLLIEVYLSLKEGQEDLLNNEIDDIKNDLETIKTIKERRSI